jgi:hypothetical protein
MQCTNCGSEMRRLMRESFLQRKIYPLFGFFPWECPICRKPIMLRARHRRKGRSEPVNLIAVKTRFVKDSNNVPSRVPASKVR